MEITTNRVGNVAVVTLRGRLTVELGASEVRQTVQDLLKSGSNQLLIDLHGVNYIDSTGIDCLVTSYTSARNRGGQLKLSGVRDRTELLLKVTRLDHVFETFPSREQALASFG